MSMSDEWVKEIVRDIQPLADIMYSAGMDEESDELVRGTNQIIQEVERLREALEGSTVIANQSGARIRELEEENQRLNKRYISEFAVLEAENQRLREALEALQDQLNILSGEINQTSEMQIRMILDKVLTGDPDAD